MSHMLLQNVIFESSNMDCRELFYREAEGTVSFDTYFNCFSYKRWIEYTGLKTLFLCGEVKGSGSVSVFNEKRELIVKAEVHGNKAQDSFETDGDHVGNNQRVDFKISISTDFDAEVLYFVWQPDDDKSRLLSARFETDDAPKQAVRIAVDMCTYRRESYVLANAKVLSEIEGVEAYIIDNGNTLEAPADQRTASQEAAAQEFKKLTETSRVHVFPNLNSGGSGGFARGMMEIQKDRAEKGFTHVLLMDDDVSFLPETFVRLKALLALRKEQYKDACVSGAFLGSEVGYIQAEGGAEWPDLRQYPHILNLDLDLRDFDTVVKNEREYHSDHAAWWFACYSLDTVEKNGLPLPFFIRLDDSEYGIRCHVPNMRLNGICVWHESSENKKDSCLYYYTVRNMLTLNAVHGSKDAKKALMKFCIRSLLSNLLRYRYKDMDLVLLAVEDFMKGPAFFEETDPASYHQKVRGMGYQLRPVEELTSDAQALEEVKNFCRAEDFAKKAEGTGAQERGRNREIGIAKETESKKETGRQREEEIINSCDSSNSDNNGIAENCISSNRNSGRGLKNYLTLNGWLLPARSKKLYVHPLSAKQEELYREGKVLFFDSGNGKGLLLEKDSRELLHFAGAVGRLWKLFGGYEKAYREFNEQGKYLESEKFWKKYLRI